LANAEQELLAGPLTEFDGPRLALWELAHALEWVALTGFVAVLAVPLRSPHGFVNVLGFVLLSLVLVPVLAALASATARLKITQATRLLWHWGSAVALVALAMALFFDHGGR
jgi:NADH-quinone oxidoreductase subunit H